MAKSKHVRIAVENKDKLEKLAKNERRDMKVVLDMLVEQAYERQFSVSA